MKFRFFTILCLACLVFCFPICSMSNTALSASSLDYSRLNAVLQDAPYCSNTDGRYSASSWENYTPILLSAIDLLNDENATQSQIDDMAENLNLATISLVYILDLREEIQISTSYTNCELDYSPLTFEIFYNAFQSATATLAMDNPTQNTVDACLNNLTTARQNLIDIRLYKNVLTRLPTDTTLFTATSYARVHEELNRIELALNNFGTTQTYFEQLVFSLDASITGLVYLADTTALQNLLNNLRTLDTAKLPHAYVHILQDAINDIQNTLNMTELTESQANATLNRYAHLPKTFIDIYALSELVEQSVLLIKEDYAPTSYQAFFNALNSAQSCLNNSNCTPYEVANCLDTLQTSIKNLIPIADKNKLLEYVTNAKNLIQSGITPQNADLLQKCIAECESIYLDNSADDDTISIHTALLQSTIQIVQSSQADIATAKAELLRKLNYVLSLNPNNYTSFSWFILQSQYSTACQIVNSDESNLTTVQDALYNLQKATNSLTPTTSTTKPIFLLISVIILVLSSLSLCAILGKMLHTHITQKGKRE